MSTHASNTSLLLGKKHKELRKSSTKMCSSDEHKEKKTFINESQRRFVKDSPKKEDFGEGGKRKEDF